MRGHRFTLTDSEQVSLDCVYGAFFTYGPDLTYDHSSPCANPGPMRGGFGGATITAFYVSNVEQYLFRADDEAVRFYKNVATLPIDSTSMFIRSSSLGGASEARPPGRSGSRAGDRCSSSHRSASR